MPIRAKLVCTDQSKAAYKFVPDPDGRFWMHDGSAAFTGRLDDGPLKPEDFDVAGMAAQLSL